MRMSSSPGFSAPAIRSKYCGQFWKSRSPAVHHGIEAPARRVQPEGHGVPDPRAVPFPIGLGLAEAVRVEPPHSGPSLQLGAGVQTLVVGAEGANVRRRADVDEQVAPIVDGDRLGAMAAGGREPRDDGLRRTCRLESARRQPIADHPVVGREVQVAVVEEDSCPAGISERGPLVGPAVTVRVPEGYDTPASAPPRS